MEWTTVACGHCRTRYTHRVRGAVPCPHCYRVPGQQLFASRARNQARVIELIEAGDLLDPEENSDSLNQQAERALQVRDWELAGRLLYRVAALTPREIGAWTRLAECLQAQGETEQARACLERALTLDPESPLVWQAKATLAAADGRAEQALRDLDYVLTLTPQDAQVWARRARILRSLKQLALALESAARAVWLEPENPGHRLELAYLRQEAGQPEARADFLDFLALSDALVARGGGGATLAVQAEEVRRLLGGAAAAPGLAALFRVYLGENAEGELAVYSQGVTGMAAVAPVEAIDRARERGLVLDPGLPGEVRWTAAELPALREAVLLTQR